MAKDDWAIAVGVKSYFDPDLGGLEGPENDANEFHKWVVSRDGGAVPRGQAQLILSSMYHPPFQSASDAMPTAEAVKAAFDHLRSIADENQKKENGRVVGRRLYLFFSGHGFKFGIFIGRLLADLAVRGETDFNIALFSAKRLLS